MTFINILEDYVEAGSNETPVSPGTVVDAEITDSGAYYFHPVTGRDWFSAPGAFSAETTRITVTHDEAFSSLMKQLGEQYAQIRKLMSKEKSPALKPGTIIEDAVIDGYGKAHFYHPETGVPWYLPEGWYEVAA